MATWMSRGSRENRPDGGRWRRACFPRRGLDEVIDGLKRALAKGARAYWVCPLIEESEKSDLAAAEERATMLRAALGEKVGLVHGRMKGPERDEIMARFKAGEISVLVATTVIEVGVDVPEASIMVVEHAERFGLAQLHQLRGRVGRGAARSTCLLVYQAPLGAIAKQRLAALRATDDGFVIAEEDLRLRGAGELLGTKQSGLPEFHFADFAVHGELVAAARDDARMVLQSDPTLKTSARREFAHGALSLRRDEAGAGFPSAPAETRRSSGAGEPADLRAHPVEVLLPARNRPFCSHRTGCAGTCGASGDRRVRRRTDR